MKEQLVVFTPLLRVLEDQLRRGKYLEAAELADELIDASFDIKQACIKAHARAKGLEQELEKKQMNSESPTTRYF
jgi:hypothetical protein